MGDDVDLVLDALGDASRRRLLEVLRSGEQPVGRIAEALPIGRPAVSKHLAVLETAGLVRHHSRGTRNLYALAPGGLAPLQRWLVDTWDVALTNFAALAEATATAEATARGGASAQVDEPEEVA